MPSPLITDVPWLWLSDSPAVHTRTLAPKYGGKIFKKEIARVGQFVKPFGRPDGTDQPFEFTAEYLDLFASSFSEMDSNGVEVPIPAEHTFDPDLNRGYVRSVFREDESLYVLAELTSDNADELARSTNVSIWADPIRRDAKGNVYSPAIRHVALTNYPVIPGLKPFEAVAASFGQITQSQESEDMSLQEIAKALGCEADETKILSSIDTLKAKSAEALSLSEQVSTLKADLANANKDDRALRLSQFPADYWEQGRQLLSMKIDALADRHTPAVLTDIKAMLTSDESLQLSALDSGHGQRVNALLAALAKAEPLRLGERTGAQVLSLGDPLKPTTKQDIDEAWGRALNVG